MKNNFVEWVRDGMDARNWTQSELARQSEMTPTAISDVLSGRRNPGRGFCEGVAKAFKIPVEEAYRAAGLLPPVSYRDTLIKRIEEKAAQLTDPRDIEKVEKFIDLLAGDDNMQKKRSPRRSAASSS